MSLEFDNVSYQYAGSTTGIEQLSLSIRTGEMLALIGASGSGKTTLLRLAAGLLGGYQGRLLLHGQDMADVPVHQRRIGMMFQHYALFPHLCLRDNVAYGLKMQGKGKTERHAVAQQLLEQVGLKGMDARLPGQLSGGQQQRVALARALAIQPRALLLDEPLSALDASIRGQLRDLIRQTQRQAGITSLLVTHDQEEALTMADRIALIDNGKIIQHGTPQELYQEPCNEQVARFVGLSTIVQGEVVLQDEVDIGFARLYCPTGMRRPGTAVKLLIRPEHIQPSPAPQAVNRLEGTVVLSRYLGSCHRYDFLPKGGRTPWLGESSLIPGGTIAIPPECIRILES